MNDIDPLIATLDVASLPSIDAAQSRKEAKAANRHTRRVAAKRFATLTQHRAAIEQLAPLPQPGEAVHGVMDGRFSAWSIATAIVELLPAPVDSITIGTLGFNRPNCDGLCALIDAGKVRSVTLVVSDYFRSSDRTIFADCRRELEARGQTVIVCRSHAKLLLIAAGDTRIVVETSANLRSSQNWEQFNVIHDAALYNFHRTWLTELVCQTQ